MSVIINNITENVPNLSYPDPSTTPPSGYPISHNPVTCQHCIAGSANPPHSIKCVKCDELERSWGAGNCESLVPYTGTVVEFTDTNEGNGSIAFAGAYSDTKFAAALAIWRKNHIKPSEKNPSIGKKLDV